MKHIVIIGAILALIILTAGCLDDLSSTLPPCCDGTCDGVKTSVITVVADVSEFFTAYYIVDWDGIYYACSPSICERARYQYPYHNVTFSYEMVNGHRHITDIIEDHDANPKCECECVKKCCEC